VGFTVNCEACEGYECSIGFGAFVFACWTVQGDRSRLKGNRAGRNVMNCTGPVMRFWDLNEKFRQDISRCIHDQIHFRNFVVDGVCCAAAGFHSILRTTEKRLAWA
jgi:hypothetical protein